MTEDQPASETQNPIVAVCPECHLEVTGSKVVEKIKPHDRHREESVVFYCPECGRFFTQEADGTTSVNS